MLHFVCKGFCSSLAATINALPDSRQLATGPTIQGVIMSRFRTLTPTALSREDFIAAFADIYEHSPWMAEQAYGEGVDETLNDIESLHARMSQVFLNADYDTQLALINAHPDLEIGRAHV